MVDPPADVADRRPAPDQAVDEPARGGHERRVEIIEAILLAVVAIATAWTGYQAARWDGENARAYGISARIRAQANREWTLGGQQRLFDSTNFSAWLQARTGDASA